MLLAILAGLVFAVLRIANPGDDTGAPVSTESPAPAAQLGHQPRPGGPGNGESYGDGRPGGQQWREPIAAGKCRASQIRLRPVVADGIRVGQYVAIQISLRTTGDAACSFRMTPDNLVVDITTSTGEPVWTTDECSAAITPTSLVLDTVRPTIVQVSWDGTRSDARCSPSTVRSAAGDYEVRTAVIGGEPAVSTFALDEPLPTQTTPSISQSSTPSTSATTSPSSSPTTGPLSSPSASPSSSPSSGHT